MDDNKVKEIISEAFFTLILAKNRFKIYKSHTGDDGVDLLVNPVIIRKRVLDGKTSRLDSGKKLDIQLKCTTDGKVKPLPSGNFHYFLKVKNYEDLIYRRDDAGIPLLLVVFILPDNENEWIEILNNQLLLRKCGYWYQITDEDDFSKTAHLKKTSNVAIELLAENILTLEFKTLFDDLWKSKKTY